MAGSIVGREDELASIHGFVASISEGATALVLEGEAGVGKTTLWTAGVAEAADRGVRVLEARPAESETALSFSGIGDLLDAVLDEALASLPAPQRRALSRALVLEEEGPPPDPHAIGVAVLNALRSLGASRPLMVAVDDVQWLDPASAEALGYGGRRLRSEQVGVLLARRIPSEVGLVAELRRSLNPGRVATLEVAPFDLAALHHVVHDHLGAVLPRPLLAEVHQGSGGNPFYALEMVRALKRTGVQLEVGQPLPVPESLHDLVHGRLLALPAESRDFLLAATAHAQPTVGVVEAASGVGRREGLAPALEAGVVELEGDRIRFTHPLLASGAFEAADADRRRAVHARLAELLEDPEARAWQLAASVSAPDEEVALTLERAAQNARARGAPRAAALLLDRAAELTPAGEHEAAVRRVVDAAFRHYESGDSPRAEAQLRDVIARLPAGRERARALTRLARVRAYAELADAAELFLRATEEAEDDVETLAVAHEGVATCLFRLYERLPESIEHAKRAAELALEAGLPALAAEALGTLWTVEMLVGRDFEEARRRAGALQGATEDLRVLAQPRFADAAGQLWLREALPQAREQLLALLERASELGDESSRPLMLAHLAEVECELGDPEAALAHAVEGQEAARQAGQETLLAHNLAAESLAEARRGRHERARALAMRALELVPRTGGRQADVAATRALGQLELSLGDPEAAVAALARLVAFVRAQAIAEPGLASFVVDHVEALIELGRLGEATELLEWYEGNARRLERTPALANCLRCRGLLAAQAGAVDSAIENFEQALALHRRVELPLDLGRTLLALGAAQRRAKRRRAARESLEEARAVFDRIGAALWAERARAELKRISGRAPAEGALTPAEERVAQLVVQGKTNPEIADALFLSRRTVEGHLSRIFGKLGIRHRRELAGALAARQSQERSPSNTSDAHVSASQPAP